MRRERREREDKKNIKNMLYLSGSVLAIAVLAFVISFIVYGNNANKSNISKMNTEKITEMVPNNTSNIIEQASSQIGKTVEESKNELIENNMNETSNISNTENNVQSNTTSINNTTVNKNIESNKKTDTVKKEQEEIKDPTFTKPVEGEIIKEFAKDNLIHSATLNEWVTHLGIDIKAEKTTIVKASADGKVKSIKNDPRYGLTIVIEHVGGFTTVYSNLLTSEFVIVGEEVKQGQTIGTVGNTAIFEIVDESHLHFEILKDNVPLDPNLYIK